MAIGDGELRRNIGIGEGEPRRNDAGEGEFCPELLELGPNEGEQLRFGECIIGEILRLLSKDGGDKCRSKGDLRSRSGEPRDRGRLSRTLRPKMVVDCEIISLRSLDGLRERSERRSSGDRLRMEDVSS